MMPWQNAMQMEARGYVCGYCGNRVGPNMGFFANAQPQPRIYLCSFCWQPTYFDPQGKQYPGIPFGDAVASVPNDVDALYTEARNSYAANSFTSAVLTCRKILMHVAVEKGAAPGRSFLEYVEYLAQKGYIPPDGKGWVDHIRQKGNEANHEIKVMTAQDAGDLITFLEMLLKFIYEFPAKVAPPPAPVGPATAVVP